MAEARVPAPGLDSDCPTCGRRSGDHTLDEWAGCLGAKTTDIPYAETPPDSREAASAALRARLGIPDDTLVADHFICRAVTMDIEVGAGVQAAKLPGLLMDFETTMTGTVQPIAKVLYLGDAETLRKFGRLVRDSANGAANAAGA